MLNPKYEKEYLTKEDLEIISEEQYLLWYEKYARNRYDSPSVTTDIVVFTVHEKEQENFRKLKEKSLEVLLVNRNEHPHKSKWSLIGGFMPIDKDLDESVSHILKEKLNIEDVYTEQLYTFSDINRDARKRVLSSSYMSLSPKHKFEDMKRNESIQNEDWFSIRTEVIKTETVTNEEGIVTTKEIDLILSNDDEIITSTLKHSIVVNGVITKETIDIMHTDLAFDHAKIIYYAYLRLQNKVSYTNIAFNLVGESFTITELQNVYEVILNKEFFKADFRRIIKKMVEETGEISKEGGYRPSKLYRYNLDWSINMF